MRLVLAKEAHIPQLVELSIAAFHSDRAVGGSGTDGPPEYESEEWHTDMMNQGHLITALEGENIVGGALLFRDDSAPDFLYIGRIFIDPALFGKGYGIRLMELIESSNPDIRLFCLDTPVWNIRTNRFYQKLGYEETRRDDEMVYYRKRRQTASARINQIPSAP